MQNGFSYSEVSTAKTVTTRLARSEQQASQNYETAVALNNMICEALPKKILRARVAVGEEYVECVE